MSGPTIKEQGHNEVESGRHRSGRYELDRCWQEWDCRAIGIIEELQHYCMHRSWCDPARQCECGRNDVMREANELLERFYANPERPWEKPDDE